MLKKLLALIAAALIPLTTHASEITYDIGGEFRANYGYIDTAERYSRNSNDYKSFAYAELNFSAEYELDDETSFGLYLDVMKNFNRSTRTLNNGSWGKEVYGIANTAYGRVLLGETYNVADQFHQGPKNILHPTNFLTNRNWNRKENRVHYKTLNSTSINTDGVAPKVTYISPAFYDTYFGVSYINNINNRRGLANKHLSYSDNDGYVVSAYNELDLGYFDAYSSLSYANFRDDDKEYSASLKLKRGNWSISSGYRKAYIDGNKDPIASDLSDNYREGYAWNVGVEYEIGPFSSSLTYLNSKAKNTDNEDKIVTFSNKYQLNKWADIYLGAAHVDYQGEDNDPKKSNKGYIVMTGIGLSF
ncbi:MAG: porin [Lactobacillus sp.]|jgi:hypothetical protein|nr:porin [Lactobacillus sp.]